MSYDLMVFAPDAAPKERNSFLEWYEAQTQWVEPHRYDNPDLSTAQLRSWFMDMIQSFPPMNGPFAPKDLPVDEESTTDYSIGNFVIYSGFAWSKAEQAYDTTFRLARKHGVGFFDASSEKADLWYPDGNGELVRAESK
jgi:hypothetical protein